MSPLDAAGEAEVVLPAHRLDETVELLTGHLGFRLETIMPADAPAVAVLSGHGLRVRLEGHGPGGRLRLAVAGTAPGSVLAPNGTIVELVGADRGLEMPPLRPTFERSPPRADASPGRAGMAYRDLLPERQGGRFVASHITVPTGGPVPDYVHHHDVRFQVIHCLRGWVRVVYQDQGPPFTLHAGDTVLQPPGIRHRVLECSAGLEVLEVTCPARHPTHADHDVDLPTPTANAGHHFGGQRFARHAADGAPWGTWWRAHRPALDSGIGPAAGGVVGLRTVRPGAGGSAAGPAAHDAELVLWYVADGTATLRLDGQPAVELGSGDAVAVPPATGHALEAGSGDLALVEVTCPEWPSVTTVAWS